VETEKAVACILGFQILMYVSKALSVGFLLLFPISLWAVDPSTHLSQYAHTAWRIQDGFFSGAPNAITQTSDGYLWIGTPNGLFRFDGVRFVPVASAAGKVVSRAIFSLLGGTDGSLWIGTDINLTRLKDGVLTEFKEGGGRVNAIIQDHNGTVWITRSRPLDDKGPLCQVAGTRLVCRGRADGIAPPYGGPLIEDLAGNFWVGSANILTRWRVGSSVTFAPEGLKQAGGLSGVQGLAVTREGSIWSGINRKGRGLGLQQLIKDSWKPFAAPGLNGEDLEVSVLFVDRENTLWVGTVNQGIYRIHDGKSEHFSGADGLSGDTVTGFYEDREGDLWVATTEGIDAFRDISVLTFSTREGLRSGNAYSVLAAHDGTVWIGNSGSLDFIRGNKLDSIRLRAGQHITSLLEDHIGQLWVGIDNALYIYKEGRFEEITGAKDNPLGPVVALAEDREGSIWVELSRDRKRLVRIKDRKVREEFLPPEVPVAISLAADPNGGIWLGMTSGLARYRNNHLETFPVSKTQNPKVLQIVVRPDGFMLGASSGGLVYWRNETVRVLTVQNGLPCDNLYSLTSGDDGVWLYSQCGLVHVPNPELQKWWQDDHTIVMAETFDVFEGARPWSTAFQPHASQSTDGRLWFANENVVQMIDPHHLPVNSIAPPVQVEQLVADHRSYSLSQPVRLPALTRDLEIDYTALSFRIPQKVRFRYKLEGHDPTWQEPQARRQAFYNDLRPGQYRFRVIACNNDGVWNETGATLDFSIAPAWFQTNWFFALSVLSGLMVVWAGVWLRMRHMQKLLAARFSERLAERVLMARELHDTLLQTLQGSKLVADEALENSSDPVHMRRAMEQLSPWLERANREGRAALNSLRTSTTQTNDLAEAFKRAIEETRLQSRMGVSFSVTGHSQEMNPVVRDEIYRIGYEAIRNAYKHSNGSRLDVSLRYGKDLVVCVSDNGVGIDPTVADQGKNGHFGLQGMRERAARIGSKLLIISSPDSGTEVRVVIPASIIFGKSPVTLLSWLTNLFRRSGRASHSD
jgi:signal transduction histidine kinase/ligand-binding sensor domain-containing protein